MTRPKVMADYPKAFLDLLTVFEENPRGVLEIPFEDTKAAMNFRLDFYAFRSAAIKEGLAVMYPSIHSLFVQVKDDPARLVISNKDFGDRAKKITEAIEAFNKERGMK